MAQAAVGFRVHSGWAAAVTVAGPASAPGVVDRRRIEIADAGIPGAKQPYHAAEGLPLSEAQALIARCRNSTWALARRGLEEISRAHDVVGCGMLLSSARPLPELASILASHALIHTAEGEFFRDAITAAGREKNLPLRAIRERELFDLCAAELKLKQPALARRLAEWGRALGPPWTQDEKYAALAAWLALTSTRDTASGSRPGSSSTTPQTGSSSPRIPC